MTPTTADLIRQDLLLCADPDLRAWGAPDRSIWQGWRDSLPPTRQTRHGWWSIGTAGDAAYLGEDIEAFARMVESADFLYRRANNG